MLQSVVVPVDMGGGIDTKNDPKQVIAGKFLRVENGVYTNPRRINKRNGYTPLSATVQPSSVSMQAPALIKRYKDELIFADKTRGFLASYLQTPGNSVFKTNYASVELIRNTIDQEHPASGYVDCMVSGNYALYAWSQQTNYGSASASTTKLFVAIYDLTTNSIIYPGLTEINTITSTNYVQPVKCFLLGGSTLAFAYVNAASNAVIMQAVSVVSGVFSLGASATITTGFTPAAFDITGTSTGGVIAYFTAAGISISAFNTSGTVSATKSYAGVTYQAPVYICPDTTTGNIWVYWVAATYAAGAVATSAIKYAIVDSTMTQVLTATTVVTLGAPQLYVPSNFTAVAANSTFQYLFWGGGVLLGYSATKATDQTRYVTCSDIGSIGTSTLLANGVTPISRAFFVGDAIYGKHYAIFAYRGGTAMSDAGNQPQPTLFCIDLLSTISTGYINASGVPSVVARFASGNANTQNLIGDVWRTETPGSINYNCNVPMLSTTKALVPYGANIEAFADASFVSTNLGALSAAFVATLDFDSANAYVGVNVGSLCVLNGAMIQAYDGQQCTELNFHMPPEIVAIASANTAGGAMAAGDYSYIAIFQWVDSQGNLHQSAPSLPATGTVGVGDNSLKLSVTTNYLSQKVNASLAIFRNQGLSSGSVYYRVNDPVFVEILTPAGATAASASVSYTDLLADASISANPQAYTYPASSVLENSAPPPSVILLSHNNRLEMVDSENPNSIWPTKTITPGVGLSPCESLAQNVDTKFGKISALAEMDEKRVIFKNSGIFVQSGDYGTDTGINQTLSVPQMIPSDVGCSSLKSIASIPIGVIFKSANGIYLLSRALGVGYIGEAVESYNSQNITAVTLIPGTSQIRFLTSTTNGLTLVYDYIYEKWATFTNHTGLSADICLNSSSQNVYTYATTGGRIFQETPNVYLDNATAFALLAQTSWLSFASIQGFQRVRRLIMLGDFVNGNSASHLLSIAAAYDFSTTFQTAITYAFGAASASGVFQYLEGLPIQKCDSISLLIQETTTGSSAEYVDLTNISFEVGVKKGLNKLGGAKRV